MGRNTMVSSEAAKVSLAARALLATLLPTGPGISPVLTNLARKATPLVSLAGCLEKQPKATERVDHTFIFIDSSSLFIDLFDIFATLCFYYVFSIKGYVSADAAAIRQRAAHEVAAPRPAGNP